jgi:hypothetical protein
MELLVQLRLEQCNGRQVRKWDSGLEIWAAVEVMEKFSMGAAALAKASATPVASTAVVASLEASRLLFKVLALAA